MASRSYVTGTFSAALLIAASIAHPAPAQEPAPQEPAAAQQPQTEPTGQPTELARVTVLAPRVVYRVARVGDSAIPQQLEVAEKEAMVEFADLDLTRTADLYTLEERVADAAARVCGELSEQFPDGTPSTTVCTRRATDDAMTRVRLAARKAIE
jgi:UrcA family protein